jgi:hypothetical protein
VVEPLGREHVEVGDGDATPSPRAADLDGRVERGEGDGRIGRVHDPARAAGDDGVVLVLALLRRAAVAAPVLETGNVAAVIPAARPLAEVAADRPHGA